MRDEHINRHARRRAARAARRGRAGGRARARGALRRVPARLRGARALSSLLLKARAPPRFEPLALLPDARAGRAARAARGGRGAGARASVARGRAARLLDGGDGRGARRADVRRPRHRRTPETTETGAASDLYTAEAVLFAQDEWRRKTDDYEQVLTTLYELEDARGDDGQNR